MISVLVVEDDLDLATAVVEYLQLEGMRCDHAGNGVTALELAQGGAFDVVILDLNLPRLDGLGVCGTLREQGNDVPVLMLTARDSLDDKLSGFDSGTDDYLVKPFAMDELLARVRALAGRRSSRVRKLSCADLELLIDQKKALRAGSQLRLSPTEMVLLEHLMRASPDPVNRADLIRAVWGDEQPDSNSLKVHMHNLRKQIDKHGDSQLLHTVAGVGYQLRTVDETALQP
jgi:DNA-binding response OmpR family regulator